MYAGCQLFREYLTLNTCSDTPISVHRLSVTCSRHCLAASKSLLDDLHRLVESCRCPALAQVSCRDEVQTDYALASLIGQQGPHDKVFVAQLRGQLLGCMAVTSMVDVSLLQQNFDLHVYDQLVQPDVYEAVLSAHSQQSAAGNSPNLLSGTRALQCTLS